MEALRLNCSKAEAPISSTKLSTPLSSDGCRMEASTGNLDGISLPHSPPIFRLPAELRINIYEYVLVDQTSEVEIIYKRIHERTAVLRTSSRLREEASRVYYGSNTFVIRDVYYQLRDVESLLTCAVATDCMESTKILFRHDTSTSSIDTSGLMPPGRRSLAGVIARYESAADVRRRLSVLSTANMFTANYSSATERLAAILAKHDMSLANVYLSETEQGERGRIGVLSREELGKSVGFELTNAFVRALQKHYSEQYRSILLSVLQSSLQQSPSTDPFSVMDRYPAQGVLERMRCR